MYRLHPTQQFLGRALQQLHERDSVKIGDLPQTFEPGRVAFAFQSVISGLRDAQVFGHGGLAQAKTVSKAAQFLVEIGW